jgi:undecaprenyl-diphosphatase
VSAFEAIVLGIVQGLTEFLPISSTAHLRIVPAFVGWEDPGAAFTAVVQLGTMAAVLLYFREDLWRIARASLAALRDPAVRRTTDARLGLYIVLGTIPIAIFGLIFKDQIETGARDLTIIGCALIALGLVLLAAEKVATHRRELDDLSGRDGLIIGLAQAAALVPGVSRSGATITAGLFLGFERTAAARYSFLLSVPAVVLSGLFELRHVGEGQHAAALPTAIATLIAFIVGYASIAFLLRYLVHHSTAIFVGYRVVLGIVVLALVANGTIS